MKILADPTIPLIKSAFPEPFKIQLWSNYGELQSLLPEQDVLICRSTLKVNDSLLKNSRLKYLATASSGTDHIDFAALQSRQIELIDAKGSNANSVADYVLAVIAALNRQGITTGKKAGIIGCGAVGSEVLKRLQMTGFEVITFDPPREIRDPSFKSASLADLLDCDILCIHAALHADLPWPSHDLLNRRFLHALKPQTVIINASRGGIINEADLLKIPFPVYYCTDVYLNEPEANPELIDFATICTPHIAGHSLEAKEKATMMISEALHTRLALKSSLFNRKSTHGPLLNLHSSDWQDIILGLYDPMTETDILKQSRGDIDAFLALRSKHHRRHDFQID